MFARNQTNYNNPFQRVGITHNELEILSQLMKPFFSYLNILAILDFVYIIVLVFNSDNYHTSTFIEKLFPRNDINHIKDVAYQEFYRKHVYQIQLHLTPLCICFRGRRVDS